MNDDEVLARIFRRFLVSSEYWEFGEGPDPYGGYLLLDGDIHDLTAEEVETLRAYSRKPE